MRQLGKMRAAKTPLPRMCRARAHPGGKPGPQRLQGGLRGGMYVVVVFFDPLHLPLFYHTSNLPSPFFPPLPNIPILLPF